jgi:hypothetical protein
MVKRGGQAAADSTGWCLKNNNNPPSTTATKRCSTRDGVVTITRASIVGVLGVEENDDGAAAGKRVPAWDLDGRVDKLARHILNDAIHD